MKTINLPIRIYIYYFLYSFFNNKKSPYHTREEKTCVTEYVGHRSHSCCEINDVLSGVATYGPSSVNLTHSRWIKQGLSHAQDYHTTASFFGTKSFSSKLHTRLLLQFNGMAIIEIRSGTEIESVTDLPGCN